MTFAGLKEKQYFCQTKRPQWALETKKKQNMSIRFLFITLSLLLAIQSQAAGTEAPGQLHSVDSLLSIYEKSKAKTKTDVGRQLIGIYTQYDAFLNDAPTLDAAMPADSLDMLVYYATDRFYVINAYYTEALAYNDKAVERGSRQQPDIHATLLCDRSYCLYKTGKMTEATTAGQEAVGYCKKTGNLLQLSRAYLYLAIVNVNISTENRPQAKEFILKAIDTNRKAGSNRQLHNTLGVACEVFCGAGEVEKAIDFGLQAVAAAEEISYDAGVANHLTQLSYAYNRNREFEKGLEAAERAIKMVEAMDIPDRNLLAISMEYKGWNLLDMGHNAEAAEVLREAAAIEAEVGNSRAVGYDMKVICEALEPIDPAGALQALKRYTTLADSMHSVQLREALGQANASFRNDELQEENAQERRMNRNITLSGLAVIVLLLIAAAAIWWASRQQRRTNRTLRKLQRAREQFFTNVTHELRTPLTVVLGLSERLDEQTPPDEVAKAGTLIHRQGGQLLNLVNQLLDISKVSSAINEQPSYTADVAAYTEMIVESFSEVARQKGITLDYEAGERPLMANFVSDYLQKTLNNLIGNALKFTPAGGKVSVRLARQKDRLHLQVADTGRGIAAEELPYIFEPFFQSDPDSGIGSGVGLTLVKQITNALKGKISVASERGKGTTFTVDVPYRPPVGEASHPLVVGGGSKIASGMQAETSSPLSEEAHTEGEYEVGRPTILVVEDNADVAYYISSLLRESYDVRLAEDGSRGLDMARELMPDLILTDLMMPNTDGLELCRQIRADELTNHIPIIVITAKATEEERLQGLAAGADAYLYKPFNTSELHIRIEKLLEQRRMLHEKYARQWKETAIHPEQGEVSDSTPEATAESTRATVEAEFISRAEGVVRKLMTEGRTDIESIASELCMSPSQLRRKLAAITGATPTKFMLHIRMQEACLLLQRHPAYTLAEIAERCGFADQSHFSHAFRRLFGMTPSQWMAQQK